MIGFRGADVPPALLVFVSRRKIAGGTPAPWKLLSKCGFGGCQNWCCVRYWKFRL